MSDKFRVIEGWESFDDDEFAAKYGGPEQDEDDVDGMHPYDNYEDDVDENLCYLLRKFFTMSKIEADVTYSDGIIDIFCFLEKKEKMSSILRCFELVDKLKRDTLQGYFSEFELWENRNGYPVFNFKFSMEDLEDNSVPF